MSNHSNKIRAKANFIGFDPQSGDKHTCMGLNSCKNLGYTGSNDCAGQGLCATVNHPCHTLNECKGQGGCGLFGTTEEFCHPGDNDCRYQGSCGAPILNSRFIAQGPNKGRSVWQLARARFEENRANANENYGPPPSFQGAEMIYGPSSEFVNQLWNEQGQDVASCGQSGDRYCSYYQNAADRAAQAQQNLAAMEKNSQNELPNSLQTCKDDGE